MKLKNLKIATGTLLSVGLFAVAGTPAVAQSLTESSSSTIEIAQANEVMPKLAEIQSINGGIATVRLQDGGTETIGVTRAEAAFLVPGETVFVSDGKIVELDTTGRIVRPSYNPDEIETLGVANPNSPMVGIVKTNVDNVVTVDLINGGTETVRVMAFDATTLAPGTRVFVNDGMIVEVDERGYIVERTYNPQEFVVLLQTTGNMTAQQSSRMEQEMMRRTTTTQQRSTSQQQQQQNRASQDMNNQGTQSQNAPVRGMW